MRGVVGELDWKAKALLKTLLQGGNLFRVERKAAKGALGSNTNYTTSYAYNEADDLTSLTDPALRIYSFRYDSAGRLKATQYPNGTFSWWGIAGTWFWIDPVNDLAFVGMVGHQNLQTTRPIHGLSRSLVYQAIVD